MVPKEISCDNFDEFLEFYNEDQEIKKRLEEHAERCEECFLAMTAWIEVQKNFAVCLKDAARSNQAKEGFAKIASKLNTVALPAESVGYFPGNGRWVFRNWSRQEFLEKVEPEKEVYPLGENIEIHFEILQEGCRVILVFVNEYHGSQNLWVEIRRNSEDSKRIQVIQSRVELPYLSWGEYSLRISLHEIPLEEFMLIIGGEGKNRYSLPISWSDWEIISDEKKLSLVKWIDLPFAMGKAHISLEDEGKYLVMMPKMEILPSGYEIFINARKYLGDSIMIESRDIEFQIRYQGDSVFRYLFYGDSELKKKAQESKTLSLFSRKTLELAVKEARFPVDIEFYTDKIELNLLEMPDEIRKQVNHIALFYEGKAIGIAAIDDFLEFSCDIKISEHIAEVHRQEQSNSLEFHISAVEQEPIYEGAVKLASLQEDVIELKCRQDSRIRLQMKLSQGVFHLFLLSENRPGREWENAVVYLENQEIGRIRQMVMQKVISCSSKIFAGILADASIRLKHQGQSWDFVRERS